MAKPAVALLVLRALEHAVVEPALGMVLGAVNQWRGARGGETWLACLELGRWSVSGPDPACECPASTSTKGFGGRLK